MLLLHLFVYISPCSVKKKSEVGKQFTNCKILWDVIFNPWKSLNFEPQGSLEIGGFGTFYILQWLVSWPKLVAQQATEHKFPSHYITSFQEIKNRHFFPPLEKRWCLLHWFDSLVLYLLILLSPFSVLKVEITWILPVSFLLPPATYDPDPQLWNNLLQTAPSVLHLTNFNWNPVPIIWPFPTGSFLSIFSPTINT